ncbi:hypothetical protein NPIL_526211 [Nephila pilipes]|uniref:Uncharacterized protein n=1 Tax=Nephila pilipes TaxID=299642 RepID=A0A8X6UB07_NEPPI|nr:hypothetical protein NPIL_526211 [Nephila pilipes]
MFFPSDFPYTCPFEDSPFSKNGNVSCRTDACSLGIQNLGSVVDTFGSILFRVTRAASQSIGDDQLLMSQSLFIPHREKQFIFRVHIFDYSIFGELQFDSILLMVMLRRKMTASIVPCFELH